MSRVCAKRFAHTSIFEKRTTGAGACLDMLKCLSPGQGPHFPVLCPRFVRKDVPPQAFLKNEHRRLSLAGHVKLSETIAGTSPSCLVPKTWPKAFVPAPVFKKKTQVPELAWTSEFFLAHGQDLTFQSCVQGWCERICPDLHFL